MKDNVLFLVIALGLSWSPPLFAQEYPHRLPVLVPESAGKSPADAGKRFHTHLRVLVAADASASSTVQFNTPATIRSVYHLPSTGGANAIAIIDAYHYPTALTDFNAFSSYFGLPKEASTSVTSSGNKNFQVVYATGMKPLSGGNYIASWNMEAALDIEWAHAVAPNAKIYLVEAASDSSNDLYYAVQVAALLSGVKEVSMSWGGSELSYEAMSYDAIFTAPGLVYLAAGGDTSDVVGYPSTSPNVISCGGTSINRNANGGFVSETGWVDTGCGSSAYEPRPGYQSGIAHQVGNHRGTNDISFDGDPNTGVYVFDSTPLWGESGWWILGGTSLATPCLAGVINLAASSGNGFANNTATEQNRLYGNLGNSNTFRDITSGTDGFFRCSVGWDYITGVGSPLGLSGK
jgi:subtilase family serine protease